MKRLLENSNLRFAIADGGLRPALMGGVADAGWGYYGINVKICLEFLVMVKRWAVMSTAMDWAGLRVFNSLQKAA